MNKNLLKGIIVASAVLVAVLAWWLYSPANNANFPGGTDWLCTNQSCKNAFNLTMKELGQYNKEHIGEPIKCPKCGSPAIRAEKCQFCGKSYPMPRDAQHRCPFCGKDNAAPPPAE
jgi:hypothetical protein